MAPEVRRKTFKTSFPGRYVWSALHLVFGMARMPLWLLSLLPQSFRQDPRYTYRKAVGIQILKAMVAWVCDTESGTPWTLLSNAEGYQWVTIDPPSPKYFRGITLADESIDPVRIGGTWYPRRLKKENASEGKVVLHFHGGAFMIGDGRKKDTEFLTYCLLKHTGVSSVLAVQYRLSSNPGGRFPAALQDAITSYIYLISDLKVPPENIIVSGDSAGGNLTLALLRYLHDHGRDLDLPNPMCAWLWSPWVNPATTFDEKLGAKDYLVAGFGTWGSDCYRPDKSTGLTLDNEYINFVDHQFPTDVPLYISSGENEVLYGDDKTTYEQFSKIVGNKVTFETEPACPHDILLVGANIGFHQDAFEAAKKAGKWMQSL